MSTIPLAEQFHSVQGEGPYAGTPAVFFRTGGCNLLCGNPSNPDAPQAELEMAEDATWLCDTIEVWRNPTKRSVGSVVNDWKMRGWLDALRSGASNLVLTGGEPLLHDEALASVVQQAAPMCVEVETNGTIKPNALTGLVDQYNVSVKLANSGMPEERRLNEESLRWFADHPDATFKFVVSEASDMNEIRGLQDAYAISNTDVMLMPAGATREELHTTRPRVANICRMEGYRFSPRLQVDIWDQATGV